MQRDGKTAVTRLSEGLLSPSGERLGDDTHHHHGTSSAGASNTYKGSFHVVQICYAAKVIIIHLQSYLFTRDHLLLTLRTAHTTMLQQHIYDQVNQNAL